MNNAKISVIVPVYNAEEYLGNALNSIINQTYQNLEIIVINDGSTDKSLEIMQKYASKDNRITIINKKNTGVSNTRNCGIMAATGEYIIFIDADDVMEKTMFSVLEEELSLNEVDVSMCGVRNVDLNGNVLYESEPMNNKHFDCATFKDNLFKKEYYRDIICNKMFKTKMLKENNIRFCEDIHINENTLFLLDVSKYASKYAYTGECLYNFLYNLNGATHGKFNLKKVSSLSSYVRALKYDLSEPILNRIKYKYLFDGYIYIYLMKKMKLDNTELKANLMTFKGKYYKDIKEDKTIPITKKISLWFMMHFNTLYCIIRRDV